MRKQMAPSRILRVDGHLPLRIAVRISSEAAVLLAAAVSGGHDAIQKFRECASEIVPPDKSGATDYGSQILRLTLPESCISCRLSTFGWAQSDHKS